MTVAGELGLTSDTYTVEQLIARLRNMPADAEVVIELPGMEYALVYDVAEPCGDEDRAQKAVCIRHGDFV